MIVLILVGLNIVHVKDAIMFLSSIMGDYTIGRINKAPFALVKGAHESTEIILLVWLRLE